MVCSLVSGHNLIQHATHDPKSIEPYFVVGAATHKESGGFGGYNERVHSLCNRMQFEKGTTLRELKLAATLVGGGLVDRPIDFGHKCKFSN